LEATHTLPQREFRTIAILRQFFRLSENQKAGWLWRATGWKIFSTAGRLIATAPEDHLRLPVVLLLPDVLFLVANAVPLSTRGNELFDYAPAAFFENFRWLVFMGHSSTKNNLYLLGMNGLARNLLAPLSALQPAAALPACVAVHQ